MVTILDCPTGGCCKGTRYHDSAEELIGEECFKGKESRHHLEVKHQNRSLSWRRWAVLCMFLLAAPWVFCQTRVEGTVQDTSGAAVVDAEVTLRCAGFSTHVVTDS